MSGFEVARGGFAGIYLLFYEGEVVYVGKSKNVLAQVSSRHYGLRRHERGFDPTEGGRIIPFQKVRVIFCPEGELNVRERELIDLYKPKCNIQHARVHRKVDLGRLITLAGLEGSEWNKSNTENSSKQSQTSPPIERRL